MRAILSKERKDILFGINSGRELLYWVLSFFYGTFYSGWMQLILAFPKLDIAGEILLMVGLNAVFLIIVSTAILAMWRVGRGVFWSSMLAATGSFGAMAGITGANFLVFLSEVWIAWIASGLIFRKK